MASGQFDFAALKAQDPFLGPFFLISYAIIVYFCLTCMFMAINCHTYDLVIHGLHLPKGATASIDGAKMIVSVKRKLRDYVEEKIPFLRRRREAAQNKAREDELKHNHECLTLEEKNGLILEF